MISPLHEFITEGCTCINDESIVLYHPRTFIKEPTIKGIVTSPLNEFIKDGCTCINDESIVLYHPKNYLLRNTQINALALREFIKDPDGPTIFYSGAHH